LNLSKVEYRQVLNSINDAKTKLDSVEKQKLSLTAQLENIDSSVASTTEKLINVVRQMVHAENEITLIQEQIKMKEITLEEQKNQLKDYLRLLYEQENSFLGVNENGEVETLKLLLADNTVGDNLKEFKYFNLLSSAGQQMVEKLDTLSRELVVYKEKVKTDRIKLQQLQTNLSSEKKALEQQKQSKENLLKITSGQEEIYNQLLEQTIKEQEELLVDLKNLDGVFNKIKDKIDNGESFDAEEFEKLLDTRTAALYKFQLEHRKLDNTELVWPVDPNSGLSAYFHDVGYKNKFGMQHNAIDIPTLQGTLMRSVADGVVYKTKDNGYGYSYIIVAHASGYMSVYGHVNDILVEEGDTVKQGGILGLSGGMPGTKGAGYMTTGPHLHFELLLAGTYVDPLDFLPISALSFESIQNLPQGYKDSWKSESSVLRQTPLSR